MDFLKEVLGEELFGQVKDALKGSEIKLADLSKGDYISKDKFDRQKEQLEQAQTDLKEQLATRDKDLKALQGNLEKAKGDTEKYEKIEKDLQALQETYETTKAEYEGKLSKQAYGFKVKEKLAEVKFSSKSAREALERKILESELEMKENDLVGFDKFLAEAKENDPDAFIQEKQDDTSTMEFVTPTPSGEGKEDGDDIPVIPFNFTPLRSPPQKTE